MKKAKPKRNAKVINITARRREAADIAKFIDAHGGKLGAFRAYQVKPPSTPTRVGTAEGEREEGGAGAAGEGRAK